MGVGAPAVSPSTVKLCEMAHPRQMWAMGQPDDRLLSRFSKASDGICVRIVQTDRQQVSSSSFPMRTKNNNCFAIIRMEMQSKKAVR